MPPAQKLIPLFLEGEVFRYWSVQFCCEQVSYVLKYLLPLCQGLKHATRGPPVTHQMYLCVQSLSLAYILTYYIWLFYYFEKFPNLQLRIKFIKKKSDLIDISTVVSWTLFPLNSSLRPLLCVIKLNIYERKCTICIYSIEILLWRS